MCFVTGIGGKILSAATVVLMPSTPSAYPHRVASFGVLSPGVAAGAVLFYNL
jgi:hypothetical protein